VYRNWYHEVVDRYTSYNTSMTYLTMHQLHHQTSLQRESCKLWCLNFTMHSGCLTTEHTKQLEELVACTWGGWSFFIDPLKVSPCGKHSRRARFAHSGVGLWVFPRMFSNMAIIIAYLVYHGRVIVIDYLIVIDNLRCNSKQRCPWVLHN
jgi:hypothetical protein